VPRADRQIRVGKHFFNSCFIGNWTVDFSKEIIEAALFNFAYDQQSEGGREIYVAELIELSAQKEQILPIIYEALKRKISDDWSIEQLFNFPIFILRRNASK
jgi:hypothetical protein